MSGALDPPVVLYLVACLCLAGVAKGLSGTGLPLIAVPLMTFAIELPLAVALMMIPIVGSNLLQALASSETRWAVGRHWPLLAAIPVGTGIGAYFLATSDPHLLERVMGAAVIGFLVLNVASPRWRIPDQTTAWAAPVAGFLAGVIGGMTAIFAPPITLYLLWTDTPKERFVAVLAVCFLMASAALGLFLASHDLMTLRLLGWSALALAPVFAGQLAGIRLRARVSEHLFRRVLQIILLGAGLKMMLQ